MNGKDEQISALFKRTLFFENPVVIQILGICSALAVTNRLINTAIMAIGLTLVTALSSLTISAIRNLIPRRIRMMVQVLVIASYVIVFDLILKAYLPAISAALGPYVGLIITNCIIMGRAEAYAQSHPPLSAFLDGLGSGLGYSMVLMIVAFVRELLGFGTLFGVKVTPESFVNWTIMIMAPSAFFVLSIVLWIFKSFRTGTK
ncbi:MAG: Na+-transporting NADH:ubiquinone oxidoreductase subunit [Thermotogota bacterium]|nr:Na+-transporting NADH:ubiquinone oxidoreductase subunit [Thermotogota bacterium]MDK2863977.1 Na+-transporting NADH:ubiquinone oxidoreductase subunit [Thermotogota bacterium]HCZ06363.1 NADH:ubiquinone reductase (Na(+)-transporting) subunit D [Thermotogota bacterium]